MKLIQSSFAKRALIVGLIAGGGILATSSFAVTTGGPAGKAGCEVRHGQHGQNVQAKWEERRAKHLSELKESLKLSPEQTAAWDTFASTRQSGMRQGMDRQAMRGEFEKLNTPQRLDRMLAMSDARRARMLERAEATKAFYAQLSPEQQGVFDAKAKPERQHRGHRHHA